MGHLQDFSSLHDPPGWASSLGRPNPISYPVSYITMQLLSLVCFTNSVGCPCSNVANTLVWRFSTKRLITFQPFLWITSQFHHSILEPPMITNLCHCQFILMFSNIHFSSDHYRLEFPPIGCLSLAVDSVLPWASAELPILQPLLIIMTLRR